MYFMFTEYHVCSIFITSTLGSLTGRYDGLHISFVSAQIMQLLDFNFNNGFLIEIDKYNISLSFILFSSGNKPRFNFYIVYKKTATIGINTYLKTHISLKLIFLQPDGANLWNVKFNLRRIFYSKYQRSTASAFKLIVLEC